MKFCFFTNLGRTLLLIAAVAAVAGWVAGCGDNGKQSGLVGSWVSVYSDSTEEGNKMDLFKDGTGARDGKAITWKVENNRFVMQSSESVALFDYKLSGFVLVLVSDDKDTVTFMKKENLEKVTKKKEEEVRKREGLAKKEAEPIIKKPEPRIEKLSEYFTDSRNGQKYRTVKIGGKTWMAQNLNYQTGQSGCYRDDSSNCEIYGRLYDWNTAKTACPAGWLLPSRQDWADLVAAAGGDAAGGKKLKATRGWNNRDDGSSGNGTDDYGFSALPGGMGGGRGEDVWSAYAGYIGYWWSAKGAKATGYDNLSDVYSYGMIVEDGVIKLQEVVTTTREYVRCIENEEEKRLEKLSSYFTDTRNGQKYRTVKIGGKTWMAQNLNYQTGKSWCYKNDTSNCEKYGRLYDWNTAKTACPAGWLLPSRQDWNDLVAAAGGDAAGGKKLKATRGWNNRDDGSSGNGTDDYGFSALPGGRWNSDGTTFTSAGNFGQWWAATENSSGYAYYRFMVYHLDRVAEGKSSDDDDESYGFAVRCVKE